MTATRFDVLGLGNAIVDVLAHAEDDFLIANKLHKGAMRLIDEAEADRLYAAMGPATIVSGGSVANSIVGVASLGGRAAYIGKVKADEVGRHFTHDIRATGVHFATPPAQDGPATARSFILVTPDGERTMNTYLGACQNLGPADVDRATVEASAYIYLEGYLWDREHAKQAFRTAASIAHAAGNKVALTLSDGFCVDRFRDEFLGLMRHGSLDILFANESELKSLYQTADFDTALAALREENLLGVVTRSEEGCLVVSRDETVAVPAAPIEELVDTTGAGDLFAAGFLYGLARGFDAATCARHGALAAAEIIQHLGARPAANLRALAEENGLPV
ncbi:adenosine kinase [Alsobacter sp. SYSU M60028]|uniref:Adenosine kinase n=1 Tax=Alsobacter ponti TaxID=2962936 RepID=A0ABT1LEJ2_9HYPH|nr:adenosine kinase [Alsobacter ponti]MCP8938643.1 adenosine kinase [Alsobacter ponti]